jgi:transcriptional regulator with XRE-family HTH domain
MLISERIQMVIKMHNLTPSSFADKIGVQRSNVSHVLSGRSKPGLDFLEKVLAGFPRVNAHWLITGEINDSSSTSYSELNQVKNETLIEEKDNNEIDRIVIFYRNGTFSEYKQA